MGRRPPLDFLRCHRSSHRPPWHELDVAQEDRRFDETTAALRRFSRGNNYYSCVTRTPPSITGNFLETSFGQNRGILFLAEDSRQAECQMFAAAPHFSAPNATVDQLFLR